MKKLLLDFVVLGEVCNFRCPYCSSRKEASRVDPAEIEPVRRNLDRTLRPLKDAFLIYRFAGGELFLAEEIIIWLLEQRFPHTQFLTNGTVLSEGLLERLREARDRVTLCVSLDGSGPDMNRLRQSVNGMTDATLQGILENISRLLEAGIPVEIQTVLSEANADSLVSSLNDYLDRFPTENFMVSIFPVRPFPGGLQAPDLEAVLSNYHLYEEILPSRDYMEGLVHSISGPRRERCRVPDHVSFRVLDHAWDPEATCRVYFCECGGLRHFYGEICSTCYTHYDLYHSILGGRTSPDHIPFPLFRKAAIREYLRFHARADRRRRVSDLVAFAKARLLGNHF
jgi:MoaA/NifB/PqqE/SkfB family radical SAM enzyme